ncbi:MAG: enoyl-CoA hydratase/isomerase family protein [Pyrinomonadaceae bacterium]
MSKELKTEIRGATLVITFVRPEIRNPLSVVVLDQLHEIVDRVASDGAVETVIFTGSGSSFASGADLREIVELGQDKAPSFGRYGQRLMDKIQALRPVTIAAINGYCFGGALDLSLACKRRVASPNARFAHPGSGLGIITGWGGTQRLPRLIGRGRALEMFFTAEPIDGGTALAWGLIDEISDHPLDTVLMPRTVGPGISSL